MPQPTTPSAPQSTSTIGLVSLTCLVLAFLAWMYLQPDRNRGDGSAVSPAAGRLPYEAPTVLAGFRPDAWFLPDDALLGFVAIPAGPFQMGGDITTDPMSFENEQWAADQAQGTVELPLFYIGRFEVTVAQFAAFVGDTGHRVSDEALRSPPDHPVSAVSWPDALAYCRWLEMVFLESDDTPEPIRRLLRAGGHVTLPSEAEWEKAARGTDGRVYPWGAEARTDRANFRSDGTSAVKAYACPECPFGLADMSGNVWEWTRSPYQPYPFDPTNVNLDAEALWVMRGGSFADTERNIRTGVRGGAGPDVRRPFIGFRVAISPS